MARLHWAMIPQQRSFSCRISRFCCRSQDCSAWCEQDLNSVLLQLPLNPSVSIHYHSAGKKHECLQEKNVMAICLLVYKMSGSPQSIKNGLTGFSVKLCVSRNFEMKMTTKGKWQDEVKSDVLGSLSQDTEGVGRTDGPTSCTSSQKVRLQQWDLPWLLIDTPCLTSAGASWSILGEIIFFILTATKTDTIKI